jgi:hypothetical protein
LFSAAERAPRRVSSEKKARQAGSTCQSSRDWSASLSRTDTENAIWYFGPRQAEQNAYTASLMAPDFKLPDINGRPHSLKDFRGKKVLLVTWASW